MGLLRCARSGLVERYDADAGLGTLADGALRFPFHCTAIADGTRQIAEGTEVYYLLRIGSIGRVEADDLLPRSS